MSDPHRNYELHLQVDAENRKLYTRNSDKHHWLYLMILGILLVFIVSAKLFGVEIPNIVSIGVFGSLIAYLIAFPVADHAIEQRRRYNAKYYLEDKDEYGEKDPLSLKVAICLGLVSDVFLLTGIFGFLFLR